MQQNFAIKIAIFEKLSADTMNKCDFVSSAALAFFKLS